MVYQPPYPWYIDPLPMVYRPPYPWYFNPPAHGISTPYLWYIKPSLMYYELLSFGRNQGGSIYHEGVQNTMTQNLRRGQNTIGKSTPGSIYHGVQNTI